MVVNIFSEIFFVFLVLLENDLTDLDEIHREVGSYKHAVTGKMLHHYSDICVQWKLFNFKILKNESYGTRLKEQFWTDEYEICSEVKPYVPHDTEKSWYAYL